VRRKLSRRYVLRLEITQERDCHVVIATLLRAFHHDGRVRIAMAGLDYPVPRHIRVLREREILVFVRPELDVLVVTVRREDRGVVVTPRTRSLVE
jgi:hypothetical protein